jgi:hypothetical protein
MHVTKKSETESQTDQLEIAAPSKKSRQSSVFALAVYALGVNACAAVYTLSPSDFALPNIRLPNVSGLVAELLPHERAPAPIPESVIAALKDIQSTQQRQADAFQEHSALLQQNGALLQQGSATFDALRHGLSDEKDGVKNISSQISTLIAKVDTLQNAITTEITSSIPKGARARQSGVTRKKIARPLKTTAPIALGGAPPTIAPQGMNLLQSPEG